MEINFVSPPNSPMTQTFVAATAPTMYKDTLFMDFTDEGRLLVCSSDVTASYWQGSVQVYPKFEDYPLGKNESYYNSTIIHDGKFLTSNKIIISESEYKLKILSTSNDTKVEQPAAITLDCIEHFECIQQIALWKNAEKVLTASDNHITVWDTNNVLKLCQDFTDYHTGVITGIDAKPNDCNMFVSIGADRRVCIWDTRAEGIAMELYRNEFSNLTSVAWSPVENVIVVGTHSGSLYMLDAKQCDTYVNIQHCYKKSIHKLQFTSEGEQLAVVGNTNEVQVYNCKGNDFNLLYNNVDKHKKYVRDAKWFNGALFTCGLGSKVVKHSY